MGESHSEAVTEGGTSLGDEMVRLTNADEVLLRQVLTDQLNQDTGELTSASFKPGSNDQGLMSTRREAAGAQECFEEWAAERGPGECQGTHGFSVGEAGEAGLPCWDDSMLADRPEHHASVDFRGLSRGQITKRARRLRVAAAERGRLYPTG